MERRLMPAVNWDEIPDEPVRPGVHRRGFGTNDVMLVRNNCEPGVACDRTSMRLTRSR
jgi:hypothetical protein